MELSGVLDNMNNIDNMDIAEHIAIVYVIVWKIDGYTTLAFVTKKWTPQMLPV